MCRDKDEMRHKKDLHPRVKEGLSVFRRAGKFLKKHCGAASVGEYNRESWFYQVS